MRKSVEYYDKILTATASSNRLSPENIPAFFLLICMYSGIMTAVFAFATSYSVYIEEDMWSQFRSIRLIILLSQFLVFIFFTLIKKTYKFQRLEAVILNLVYILFSLDAYMVYFAICDDKDFPVEFMYLGIIVIAGGIITMIFSTRRAIRRVNQGKLKKDGEGLYKYKKSEILLGGALPLGLTMLGGPLARALSGSDNYIANIIGTLIYLIVCGIIQFGIALAWPEVLLLAYCKFRYKAFIIKKTQVR